MKSVRVCATEQALDEFLRQELRLRGRRKPKSVHHSPEVSPTHSLLPVETPSLLQSGSSAQPSYSFLDFSLDSGKKRYRSRKPVLPNLKKQPFGAHQSYNSFRSIREQFLVDWDDWDKKQALRLRHLPRRRPKVQPVLKELPPIVEHKVTARLALKNFYLLKRKGFSQIAKDLNKSESVV